MPKNMNYLNGKVKCILECFFARMSNKKPSIYSKNGMICISIKKGETYEACINQWKYY